MIRSIRVSQPLESQSEKYLNIFSEIEDEKIKLFTQNAEKCFSNKTNIRITEGLQVNNIISRKCAQNKNKAINCLEIGVGSGASTFSIIAGNKNLRLDSIDISENNLIRVRALIRSKKSKMPEMNNIDLWHVDSLKFLDYAIKENMHYDFVFVDGLHCYNHVSREVDKIMQITSPESFLFFDDAYESCEFKKGVHDSLKENISKRKFLEGHYIDENYYGVIRKRERKIFEHDMQDIMRVKYMWDVYMNHPKRWYAKNASPFNFVKCFPGRRFKWD